MQPAHAGCDLVCDPAGNFENEIDDIQPIGDCCLRQNKADEQAEHLFWMPKLSERGCLLEKGHRKEQDQQGIANTEASSNYV